MKIVIWGTDITGQWFAKNVAPQFGEMVAFTQSTSASIDQLMGLPVVDCETLPSLEVDLIFVASSYIKEIKEKMRNLGLDETKAFFLAESKLYVSQNLVGEWRYSLTPESGHEWIILNKGWVISNDYNYMHDLMNCKLDYDFWNNFHDFSSNGISNQLAVRTRDILNEEVFPLFGKNDIIFDLPCASGEYSELAAKHVYKVEGFDYSQNLVDTAIEQANEKQIKNVLYRQADASTMTFDKIYDGGLMMSLLIYFVSDEVAAEIIKKLRIAIKTGGYLFVKESLQSVHDSTVYGYGLNDGYFAVYRRKDMYEKMLVENGFKKEREWLLSDDIQHGILGKKQYGYLLK